mgnify:CR=1 FL=1
MWNAVIGSEHNPSFNTGCDDCPVEGGSWNDAQVFVTKLSILTKQPFRLPTEVEWEYAARGGRQSKGYKYSGSHHIDKVAWYIDNYQKNKSGDKGTTHPVGMKQPNELGLYDMSGNVWEWCEDLYTKEYEQNGKSVHSGWPFEGTHQHFLAGPLIPRQIHFFSAEYCEVEVGEEQPKGAVCPTLITIWERIVMNMAVSV